MQREFLQNLGLSDEQVQAVLTQHGKSTNEIEGKLAQAEEQVTDLQNQISDRDKQLKKLEKTVGDNQELAQEIDKLRKENEQTAKDYQSKITKQAKDFAISNALKDAGAKNTKATLALLDMDKVSVDEDGQLFGLSEQLEELQKIDAYLFTPKQEEKQEKSPVSLFAGGNPSSDIAKDPKNMSLEEQTELYRKDPAQWKSWLGNKQEGGILKYDNTFIRHDHS